jgi:hypothetical protein
MNLFMRKGKEQSVGRIYSKNLSEKKSERKEKYLAKMRGK